MRIINNSGFTQLVHVSQSTDFLSKFYLAENSVTEICFCAWQLKKAWKYNSNGVELWTYSDYLKTQCDVTVIDKPQAHYRTLEEGVADPERINHCTITLSYPPEETGDRKRKRGNEDEFCRNFSRTCLELKFSPETAINRAMFGFCNISMITCVCNCVCGFREIDFDYRKSHTEFEELNSRWRCQCKTPDSEIDSYFIYE
jgi:hypothetical protein